MKTQIPENYLDGLTDQQKIEKLQRTLQRAIDFCDEQKSWINQIYNFVEDEQIKFLKHDLNSEWAVLKRVEDFMRSIIPTEEGRGE